MLTEAENEIAAPRNGVSDYAARGAWFTLAVLVGVALFAFVDRQVLALLTVQVAGALSLRDAEIGIIQGLGSAFFAILAIYPIGYLTDRFDRRFVLSACVLIWSAGTIACGFAQGFWSLFIAVVAISAGEAGLPALAYSAIPDMFGGRRRILANQVFYVALILSSAIGIGFGGAASAALDQIQGKLPTLFDGVASWRLVFFAVALPAPILVGLIAMTRLGVRGAVAPKPSAELRGSFTAYMRSHGRPAFLVICALSFYGLPFLAILTWTPAALTRLFDVTPGQNGLGLGLGLAVGCLLGVGLASWLMRRHVARLGGAVALRISFWALLTTLPVIALYVYAESAWQVFGAVTLFMVTGTLIGSLLPGILQGLAPADLRGRVVAVYGIVSVVIQGLGVSLVGPISDELAPDPRALLMAVSGVLAVSWAFAALLMRLSEAPFKRLLGEFGDVP